MHPVKHFNTITAHHMRVLEGCFRVGLYWQGLTHDLSKYSVTEFWRGARYYQGTRSPNAEEREEKGYSEAWMHHKGRNRHHYEYWTDINPHSRRYEPVEMPRKYLVEMVMDRRAACKTYQGKNYHPGSELEYLERSRERLEMHPETLHQLTYILTMLRDEGEKPTFCYLRDGFSALLCIFARPHRTFPHSPRSALSGGAAAHPNIKIPVRYSHVR